MPPWGKIMADSEIRQVVAFFDYLDNLPRAARSLSKASAKRRTPSSVSLSVASIIEIPSYATVSIVSSAESYFWLD